MYIISTTYPVPKTGVKPSLLNEVPYHLEVALIHCLVETVLSKVVQVKPAVSKYGHEVLDNLQVASNSSKVESVQKVLHKIRVHVAIQINTNLMQTNSVQYHTGFWASTSAFIFSVSSLTMWRWPYRAALCKGTQPSCKQRALDCLGHVTGAMQRLVSRKTCEALYIQASPTFALSFTLQPYFLIISLSTGRWPCHAANPTAVSPPYL